MKLKTETNTSAMQARVLTAARKILRQRKDLSAHFEHGQWWIMDSRHDRSFSVVDAEGGSSVNGFDLEEV